MCATLSPSCIAGSLYTKCSSTPSERRSTWEELSRTIPGMDVRIVLPDTTRVRGRAIGMVSDALVLDVRRTSKKRLHGMGRLEIPRSEVSVVELSRKPIQRITQ